jgi:endoglycosylceramidase
LRARWPWRSRERRPTLGRSGRSGSIVVVQPLTASVKRAGPKGGTLVTVLVLALLAASAAAARAPSSATRLNGLSFLHVTRPSGPSQLARVADASGREVLLRGVNVNGLEDYYADSATPLAGSYPIDPFRYRGGRCPARNPAVESMAVCSFDAVQVRALGYDSIRLAISWSLLEPRPGVIDQTYLDRIAQVVHWFALQGVWSILDMHQDAWSKYLYTPAGQTCTAPSQPVQGAHESDGAPQWASPILAPVCMNGARELDPAVIADFQRFYDDVAGPDGVGLQEHFARVVRALAQRFARDPAVAGYELFNEPHFGTGAPPAMDEQELFPFYAKVVRTVLAGVPGFRQLFFVEPDILRDVTDRTGLTRPWSSYSSYPNVVYTPHVYTRVFTPKSFPLDGGYLSAVSDAHALGLPLWVGEFGNGVSDDGVILRAHYDNQDMLEIGSSLWVWKADLKNGFSVLHGPFGKGVAFPSRVMFSSRAYPIATAGRLESLRYDPDTGAFAMTATLNMGRVPRPRDTTVIFLPARSSGRVRAHNATVRVHPLDGGTREALIRPGRGRYEVSVAGR